MHTDPEPNSAFTLGRKSLDMSGDMRPSVKALGHMCGDSLRVPGIVYI